jgi:aryl-alcohol dehydrogenase-like predicted oxidoreductase
MEYRPLGQTGIAVSEICLGTMQFIWTAPEPESLKILDTFTAAGGTFIDTADIYTQWADGLTGGEAETVIGKWMERKGNRRQVILATKVRGRMWDGPYGEGLSRAHIVRACEDSLRRLRTDYIDLYQCHWYDETTPIEETLRALDDLVRAGKVRAAGASNYTPAMLAEALATAKGIGVPGFISYQPRYNLLERAPEREILWLVRKYHLSVIAYSPLMRGLLTGKYKQDAPLPKSARADSLKAFLTPRTWKILGKLEDLAGRRDRTPAQVALAWLLGHDWLTAPIVGANTAAQMEETLGAVGLRLTEPETAELDEASK